MSAAGGLEYEQIEIGNALRRNGGTEPRAGSGPELAADSAHVPSNGVGDSVHWDEAALAGLALMAWVVLFTIGYTVPAKPYENVLKDLSPFPIFALAGALVMFVVSSVPTNVLLLSCIAGGLGTAYRRSKGIAPRGKAQDYMLSATSSFFIYLVLLAGLMSLTAVDSVASETAEKQIQLAGTASVCAFLVGYDRNLLVSILERAAKVFIVGDNGKRPSSTRAGGFSGNRSIGGVSDGNGRAEAASGRVQASP